MDRVTHKRMEGQQQPQMQEASTHEESGTAPAFAEAEGLTVEHEGVGAGPIGAFIVMMVIGLVITIAALFVLTEWEETNRRAEVLDQAQYYELRETEAAAVEQLRQYEVLDPAAGVYRIPIDRAIDLMVNEAYQASGRTYSSELRLRPGN